MWKIPEQDHVNITHAPARKFLKRVESTPPTHTYAERIMNGVKRSYPTQIVKYNHPQPLCKGAIDRVINNLSKKRVKIEIVG
jgi:hypothetical protein